jgi:hypothetical protein
MHHDPITEEILAIRQQLAAAFDNDLARIAADLRQREAASGRTFVQLPKRPARKDTAEHIPLPPLQADSST